MNYSLIKVPYLSEKEIHKHAKTFRQQYWDCTIPVDIERIIEIGLKINIIPVNDMISYCDTDALISSNWENVFVDNDKFIDERYSGRLRFSFAHEIGHFFIHKKLYQSFGITSIENFYRFIKEIDEKQYGYLETQANKFASALLLPKESLSVDANKLYKQVSSALGLTTVGIDVIISYIAKPIAQKYGVSETVAEIALNGIKNKDPQSGDRIMRNK